MTEAKEYIKKMKTLTHRIKKAKGTHGDGKERVHSGPWALSVSLTLGKLHESILQREEADGIPREFEYLWRRLRQEMENLDQINDDNRDN